MKYNVFGKGLREFLTMANDYDYFYFEIHFNFFNGEEAYTLSG